jgi:hypothetical protein
MEDPFDALAALAGEFEDILPAVDNGEDCDEDDLFGDQQDHLEEAAEEEEEDPVNVPKFAELYTGMDQTDMCGASTEKALRSIWPRWHRFCTLDPKFKEESWVAGHGLQLYKDRVDLKNHTDYNQERVDKFFVHLRDTNVPKTMMGKAKTFLNTNLKCEHHCRLLEKGFYASPVQIQVGLSLSVKSKISDVQSRAASLALDQCEDIQAGLEQLIPADKIREMNQFVLRATKGGAVSKLAPINRLIYACHFNLLMATARRGEELQGQRMIQ